MSGDRCFSNPNKCETSSDHTRITKQKTIFNDIVNQVQGQSNFIKSNGVNYNQNFGLHNNCLAFAKSYDLLLDVTKGKYLCSPTEDPNWVSNEAWSAGLYSVDYSMNGVNVVVDTSYNAGNGNHIIFPMTQPAFLADISWNGMYPGVRVDPSYNIFYNECEDENYWRKKLVDMSFNNTNYYKQSKQQSEKLYGMYYPSNVSFNYCNIPINISEIASYNLSTNMWYIDTNKTIKKCEVLIIPTNTVLILNAGIKLTSFGKIIINGSFYVDGQIDNSGIIENKGIFNAESNIGLIGGVINNISNGSIINYSSGFLVTSNPYSKIENSGVIENMGSFQCYNNSNIINNFGGIIENGNGGTIYNQDGGQIDNFGGTITNDIGGTINNESGGTIYNQDGGQIDNFGGTITNNVGGTINNESGGTINNTSGGEFGYLVGTILNNGGEINNNNGGVINNVNTATILNNGGTITNNVGGTIFSGIGGSNDPNNPILAIITNEFGGIIFNDGGVIQNQVGGRITNLVGSIITNSNSGEITNIEEINNSGEITNNTGGVINNLGTLYNLSGTIQNNSFIYNISLGTIENNNGTINNNSSSLIENIESTINNINIGIITNYGGTIENTVGSKIYNNTNSTISNQGIGQINNNGDIFSPTVNVGCGIGFIIGSITGTPFINACS